MAARAEVPCISLDLSHGIHHGCDYSLIAVNDGELPCLRWFWASMNNWHPPLSVRWVIAFSWDKTILYFDLIDFK
jgi:hypothetical protein